MHHLRAVLWRGLADFNAECCTLHGEGGGWRLAGTKLLAFDSALAEVRYRVDCDPAWVTRAVLVELRVGGEERALRLAVNDRQRWTVNGAELPALRGCHKRQPRGHPRDEHPADPPPCPAGRRGRRAEPPPACASRPDRGAARPALHPPRRAAAPLREPGRRPPASLAPTSMWTTSASSRATLAAGSASPRANAAITSRYDASVAISPPFTRGRARSTLYQEERRTARESSVARLGRRPVLYNPSGIR